MKVSSQKNCAHNKKKEIGEVSGRFYLFKPYKLITGTHKQKHKFSGNYM